MEGKEIKIGTATYEVERIPLGKYPLRQLIQEMMLAAAESTDGQAGSADEA